MALTSQSTSMPPHVPYKLWADMYYSNRNSALAQRSVDRAVRRVESLRDHRDSIFPPSILSQMSELTAASRRKTSLADPIFATMPDLMDLRTEHGVTPFIMIKAALSIFLAAKTRTRTAVFGQVENGRTWPSLEPWAQEMLPDCMDVAGPTLERTVQIVAVSEITALDFMSDLTKRGELEGRDVHAPWDMVRDRLGSTEDRALFDTASMSVTLNYIPIRTTKGVAVFKEMVYHGTRTNCESAWLYFCGVEGQGKETRFWTRTFAVDDIVSCEEATTWSHEVMSIASWLSDRSNWLKSLAECPSFEKVKAAQP